MLAVGAHIPINGVELYYEEQGTGAPILCIHGGGSSAMVWGAAPAKLARLGRVIAYDRRGCARSERPQPYERTTVGEHSDDAAALLDALSARPAIVLGRSLGGWIAVDLALRYPDLVRALVLLEPDVPGLSRAADDWVSAFTLRIRAVASSAGVGAVGEALIREVAGANSWENFPAEIRKVFTDNGPAILTELRAYEEPGPDASAVAGVTRPTLLVMAEDSPPEFHEPVEALERLLPISQTLVVDGGHLIDPAGSEVMHFIEDIISG